MNSRLGSLGFVFAWLAAMSVLAAAALSQAAAGDNLVVHEWGTFTSLQDETGRELTGINTDDEPVPQFVHNLNPFLLSRPVLSSLHWQYRQKGAPRLHPLVTMRLETPVLYFYPPKSWKPEQTVDVSVRFRGGWLTEFYPQAQAQAPGLDKNIFNFGELTRETTSSLTWNDLRLGGDGQGPATGEQVWLAPRKVAAANVTTPDNERERYLFYRGVGNLRAPLRATMDRKARQLSLAANFSEVFSGPSTAEIPPLWLVQVRQDGACAFRTLAGLRVSGEEKQQLVQTSCRFDAGDFRPENHARLEAAMHAALVADGLFADEATALLTTWQKSYFVSPGLRLFYLVPRVWTDYYLPLSLSAEARVERAMIGRLELVSDEQQQLLGRLANTTPSDGKWVERIPESLARERFLAGRTDFGDLGVQIPADYQMYLDLGRFRNALVVNEERVRPTASLTKFIDTYELHPFRLPAVGQASRLPE